MAFVFLKCWENFRPMHSVGADSIHVLMLAKIVCKISWSNYPTSSRISSISNIHRNRQETNIGFGNTFSVNGFKIEHLTLTSQK